MDKLLVGETRKKLTNIINNVDVDQKDEYLSLISKLARNNIYEILDAYPYILLDDGYIHHMNRFGLKNEMSSKTGDTSNMIDLVVLTSICMDMFGHPIDKLLMSIYVLYGFGYLDHIDFLVQVHSDTILHIDINRHIKNVQYIPMLYILYASIIKLGLDRDLIEKAIPLLITEKNRVHIEYGFNESILDEIQTYDVSELDFDFDQLERHEYMSPKVKNLFTVGSTDSAKAIVNDPFIPITTKMYLEVAKIIKKNNAQINADTPNLTIFKLLGSHIKVPSTFCNTYKKLEFPACK